MPWKPRVATSSIVLPPVAPRRLGHRWTERLIGRIRTGFDVPEVESAYGVWRATIWARQYEATLGIPARELSTALVIRLNAIVLAMQQSFWDKYGVAESSGAGWRWPATWRCRI